MSSCQGELPNTQINVKAVDQDGNVIMEDAVNTLANGFLELWLPRNKTIELTLSGLNRTASGKIGTYPSSKTCITTFRLQ